MSVTGCNKDDQSQQALSAFSPCSQLGIAWKKLLAMTHCLNFPHETPKQLLLSLRIQKEQVFPSQQKKINEYQAAEAAKQVK